MSEEPGGEKEGELVGLGGWLILVQVWTFLLVFRDGIFLLNDCYVLFSSIPVSPILDQNSPEYDPTWQSVWTGLAVCYFILVVAFLYLQYLYFSKRRTYRRAYTAFVCVFAVFSVGVAISYFHTVTLQYGIPSEMFKEKILSEGYISILFGELVFGLFWAPYILLSERVKQTFVR